MPENQQYLSVTALLIIAIWLQIGWLLYQYNLRVSWEHPARHGVPRRVVDCARRFSGSDFANIDIAIHLACQPNSSMSSLSTDFSAVLMVLSLDATRVIRITRRLLPYKRMFEGFALA
ncbi:hypothetical protein BDZ89DRAFT_711818 [Hymenopellis radicata]|nr:hypothetical protein BDZ89DRAFT_711818 [Hymenopellis radicata]